MVSRFSKVKLINEDDPRETISFIKKTLPKVLDILVVEVNIPRDANWLSIISFLSEVYSACYTIDGPRIYIGRCGEINFEADLTLRANEDIELEEGDVINKRLNFKFGWNPKWTSTVFGGTFDYMHSGHWIMLSAAGLVTAKTGKITIGLTGEGLLQNKANAYLLQPWEFRKNNLTEFYSTMFPNLSIHIEELNDPVGPAGTLEDIQGIVLTEENATAIDSINQVREQNNCPSIDHIVVPLIQDTSSSKVSSTAIRNHLVDKSGGKSEWLYERWNGLWAEQGLDNSLLQKWWCILVEYYQKSYRYYHTLLHVAEMIEHSMNLDLQNRHAFELAIWFHDVIYIPEKHDNEEASNLLYLEFCEELGIGKSDQVCDSILATIGHKPRSASQDELYFLDCDLSILSSNRYLEYCYQIRNEYIFYTSEDYAKGRIGVLEKFLARDEIYYTTEFKEKFEAKARENISEEINSLKASIA